MFPAIPWEDWADTRSTLHRFAQVVGKIRLAASPRRNHWWNVPFHVTGRGLTTRPMGTDPIFTIDFDLVDHRLLVHSADGRTVGLPLAGQSVASFHRGVFGALDHLGVDVRIRAVPFDLPGPPFAEDAASAAYDPAWANRYWQVLGRQNLLLEEFAGRYSGKTSPVHHFWHTFDLALTRFSDRRVDQPADVDPVTREAYSREVVSSGFWFGDESHPAPACYSYTAPEPPGLDETPLRPSAARWTRLRGSLAVLDYDDARVTGDPGAAMLDFWESAYRAGAGLAGWDVDGLACPGGVTDPRLRAGRPVAVPTPGPGTG
jgi:hypothetical protein